MAQRVRKPYRGQSPSSVTQLPILTALHAGSPTLFGPIIHHIVQNVKTLFGKKSQTPIWQAGSARGQCVRGAVHIVTQVKTARYRHYCNANRNFSFRKGLTRGKLYAKIAEQQRRLNIRLTSS